MASELWAVLTQSDHSSGWFTFPILVFFVAAMIYDIRHQSGRLRDVCPKCQFDTREDGEEFAQAHPYMLYNAHRPGRFWLAFTPLLVINVGFTKTGTLTSLIISILMLALVVAYLNAIYQHSRVQPWCKWCRGGGGDDDGDDHTRPEPDPTGAEIPDYIPQGFFR